MGNDYPGFSHHCLSPGSSQQLCCVLYSFFLFSAGNRTQAVHILAKCCPPELQDLVLLSSCTWLVSFSKSAHLTDCQDWLLCSYPDLTSSFFPLPFPPPQSLSPLLTLPGLPAQLLEGSSVQQYPLSFPIALIGLPHLLHAPARP